MQDLSFYIVAIYATYVITQASLFSKVRLFFASGNVPLHCPLCVGFWIGMAISMCNPAVNKSAFLSLAFGATVSAVTYFIVRFEEAYLDRD